ncbi:MAG: glycosyl transferase family protein [Sphingobium sp.]|nr:glycosyl transferase family protein [Sphingobium sp.]MCP5399232.1 glycosyl transferase family protein [Sphingomonas sp.]
MEILDTTIQSISFLHNEIIIFAVFGFIIGGIDDFIIDILYLIRKINRRLFIYSIYRRMTGATLPQSAWPGEMAIFIPAWNEANVIGAMLRNSLNSWRAGGFHIFVGVYPNDPNSITTIADIAASDARVTMVIAPHDGPTTKADCLNHIWAAMTRAEKARGMRFKAIVLHDAEDVVHADEIRLFDMMIDRFDMVQIPVRPLLSQQSQWVAGHYADEFAESHGKHLVMREAIGAAVPSAGVGCAIKRGMMAKIAALRHGEPFDSASLTEDYEIGLRIAELEGRTAFVVMNDAQGGLICTQEHFPDTLKDAVKQKARWFVGISLAGWDRMGWSGSWQERWMRLHDRRGSLSALVLFAAYMSVISYGILLAASLFGRASIPDYSPVMHAALLCTSVLMFWRLSFRFAFSARAYGWKQGLLAIPRTLIANIIAMLAARRAMGEYWKQLRGGPVVWDKTSHRFPGLAPEQP